MLAVRLVGLAAAAAFGAAVSPVAAGGRGPAVRPQSPPSVEALLDAALSYPSASYRGEVGVVSYWGGKARAHEARVEAASGNRYRWEFLAPSGAVERVVVSDGKREEVRVPGRAPEVFVGDAVGEAPRDMDADDERRLLLKNYTLEASGSDSVAGRPVWVLHIEPREKGKPRQELWLDRETRVVLQSRRYHPDGARAAVSRFHRFEAVSVPDARFELSAEAEGAPRHGLEPTDEESAAVLKRLPAALAASRELPFGFSFDGADEMRLKGTTVSHLRWTDGLVSLSLFVSDRPARASGVKAAAGGGVTRPLEGDPGPGRVLSWKAGGRHYTLMGDLSEQVLRALQARLAKE